MDTVKARLCACLLLLALTLCGSAIAAPEVGWWWNPNESGRGFFIESQNGIVYLAAYVYESDGRATWLVAGGPNADPYNYSGRLLAYRGGQTLFGDYQAPAAPTDAGAVSFHFDDDTHGTIALAGLVIPIERQRFGGDALPAQPASGWWWNSNESGRGYSIEVQGDKLFIVAFMYDDAGNAVWYYSAGPMDSPTTYTGPWLQFANGQTLGGPYHPPSAPVTVGQLSVEFTAIDQATVAFTDTTATEARALRKGKVIDLTREFPTTPSFKPAPEYGGLFSIVFSASIPGITGTIQVDGSVGANMRWVSGELALPPSQGRGGITGYDVAFPQATARFSFSLKGVDGSTCSGRQSVDVSISDASFLTVNGYAEYQGQIRLTTPGTVMASCQLSDGSSPTLPIPVSLFLPPVYPISGKVGYDPDTKQQAIKGSAPFAGASLDWNFIGSTP